MLTEERWVTICRKRLFIKTWTPGQAAGAPLVLLHDSLGCTGLWRQFPEALCQATGRPVIAYDRLGFGRSDARTGLPAHDFIREEAAVYFPEIKRQLGLEQFVVFGHSVGGAMALMIAARFPESCEAVITESAQAAVEVQTLAGIRAARAAFQQPGQLERLKKWHGNKARWVLDAWTEVWLSPEFSDYSLVADLPKVTCPALVIHGSADEYGSRQFPETIAAGVAGRAEMHLLQGVGHVPHKEATGLVLQLVQDFLHRTSADPQP